VRYRLCPLFNSRITPHSEVSQRQPTCRWQLGCPRRTAGLVGKKNLGGFGGWCDRTVLMAVVGRNRRSSEGYNSPALRARGGWESR